MSIIKFEDRPGHWSDCSVFNEPASDCDCGGLNLAAYDAYRAITSLIPTPRSLARFVQDGVLPSLVEVEDAPTRRVVAVAPPAHLESPHNGRSGLAGADSMDFDNTGKAPVGDAEPLPGFERVTSNVPPHESPPRSSNGPTDKGGSQ